MGVARTNPPVGLLLVDTEPAADQLETALAAEQLGFEELWVPEDYFFGSAISVCASVLARTDVAVGIGVMPTGGRSPAVLALELAGLESMYPGRLVAGLGAGIPGTMAQAGRRPRSPLGAVRDTTRALRGLLEGETVSLVSETFELDGVAIGFPPAERPPLYVGASGPKMLKVSGEEADGTILSVLSGAKYVAWAREQLDVAGAGPDHRMVAYALCGVDPDPVAAADSLRELVALFELPDPRNPLSEIQGHADEAERLAELPLEEAAAAIPQRWLDELTVAGTPEQCAEKILALLAAGADSVALCLPPGPGQRAMLELVGREVLPLVNSEVSR